MLNETKAEIFTFIWVKGLLNIDGTKCRKSNRKASVTKRSDLIEKRKQKTAWFHLRDGLENEFLLKNDSNRKVVRVKNEKVAYYSYISVNREILLRISSISI